MSYTRRYNETVSKVVSTTVRYNYPASQNGGSDSTYVEIEAQIPVEVNIHVDTNPFDNSVQHCSANVNLLTAAVVATESAEIMSREMNSKKVADTVISGFFSYVRSEISQQIAELSQNIEAQLMHLKELAQSCYSKKKQLEGDYNRISSRYVKIFNDLNNELSNRIYELDKPAFVFKKETDNQKIRTSNNDLVNTVSIFGTESSGLQSNICASIAKKRALDTLKKAKLFLWQQKYLNATIQQSMLNENICSTIFTPICFLETNNHDNQFDKDVFSTEYLPILKTSSKKKELIEQFSSNSLSLGKLSQGDLKNISLYFNAELNNKSLGNDQHSVRVRQMIQKIANFNLIDTINFQQT